MKQLSREALRQIEVPAPAEAPIYTANQLKVLQVLEFFEAYPDRWCSDGPGDQDGRTMCFASAAVYFGCGHFSVFLPGFIPLKHNDKAGSLKNMMDNVRQLAKLPSKP